MHASPQLYTSEARFLAVIVLESGPEWLLSVQKPSVTLSDLFEATFPLEEGNISDYAIERTRTEPK